MKLYERSEEVSDQTRFMEEVLVNVKKAFSDNTPEQNDKHKYEMTKLLVVSALDYMDIVRPDDLDCYDDVAFSALWAIDTMFSEDCSMDAIDAYVTDTLKLLDRIRD